MNLRRSKSYVAVLMGGIPIDADRVMELIMDKNQRLFFAYGYDDFILYFHSRKSINEIRHVFSTILRDTVNIILVFRYTKDVIHIAPPNVSALFTDENVSRGVGANDINALRVFLLSSESILANFEELRDEAENQDASEDAGSENDILNQLLMKMKTSGYNSLTPAELDFIKTYKNNHKKDNNQKDDSHVD